MKGENIDPHLMTPIMNYILPGLPKNMNRKFWCNVPYERKDSYPEVQCQ